MLNQQQNDNGLSNGENSSINNSQQQFQNGQGNQQNGSIQDNNFQNSYQNIIQSYSLPNPNYNPFNPNQPQDINAHPKYFPKINDPTYNENGIVENGLLNNNNSNNNNALENGISNSSNNINNNSSSGQKLPSEYYGSNGAVNYELATEYLNQIRNEVEENSPLVSDYLDITVLLNEYENNPEYFNSVQVISKKYKKMRKIRRDGNCFYRAYIYRLFEYICMYNKKDLFEKVKKKIMDSKELILRNGYELIVFEDFYNLFLEEFENCFKSLEKNITVRDYLDKLFSDKEKGSYLVFFIRFCIGAYLKENRLLYEVYVEDNFNDFDCWVQREVVSIDHEADQIQIMAIVNYFDIGVRIEYLNKFNTEVVKFPEDKQDNEFFINLLFTPGHYDILYIDNQS